MRRATLAVYRALHRQARQLAKTAPVLHVREPLDTAGLGRHQWSSDTAGWRKDALRDLLPGLLESPSQGSLSGSDVQACIRNNFRLGAGMTESEEREQLLDLAFAALRVLSEQMHMAECSSTATTRDIFVEMTSMFTRKHTPETNLFLKPGDPPRYMFLYRCRIENCGTRRVRLLGRHWIIEDRAGRKVEVPKGSAGVVGCTPILKPGDCFEYYSGTDLDTSQGTMRGSFQMTFLDEANNPREDFDAEVAPFRLIGS
ncbi:hypothetical protein WJX72_008394 [[Myrmecia] bisecta]|uniref:ApaG domain-containing protein n=1 Tax=[Myrmecia] bisecta TaxID=41462 RepID=A0AAW1Q1J9_9CHLO